MANDREKLIELLVKDPCYFEFGSCGKCRYHAEPACYPPRMADHLLANGVTFAKDTDVPSKWISADHPPENWKGEGGYLTNFYVYTPEYGVDIGNYMRPANKWLCMGIPCNVTHWMPLPLPPKEEPK